MYRPENQARSARRKKELFRKLKSNETCFDCNNIYPYYVLHFDHVEDKRYEVANLRHASLEKLLSELEKCDLICANCHAIRTFQRKQGNSMQQSPVKRLAAVTQRNAKARSLMAEIPLPKDFNGTAGGNGNSIRSREQNIILKEFLKND